MLRQARLHRENHAVAERVVDSSELERERGTTIQAEAFDPRAADSLDDKV